MKKKHIYLILLIPFVSALLGFGYLLPAHADDETVRSENPGFRTDLGIYVLGGGHQCLRGGSGYALCSGKDTGWETSFGIAMGFIVRPFRHFSFGIDGAYMNMISRFNDKIRWADLNIGPVVRVHLPIRLTRAVIEPSLGVQGGIVQGNIHDSQAGYMDKHIGPFFTGLAGINLFLIPGFGFGFELRITGTFYQEVCFEGTQGRHCRGTDDDSAFIEGMADIGDRGMAEYPWKIFYGGHLIYYF